VEMLEFGAYEAKTKLPELLRRVESSKEEIIITRFGEPIAKLSPVQKDVRDFSKVIDAVMALRKNVKKADISIKAMIEEGRRY
jgi:prevent-host-death family protein